MTVDGQLRGVGAALQVGDDDIPVNDVPGGTVHAAWPSYTGDLESNKGAHSYAIGSLVLAIFLGSLLLAGRRGSAWGVQVKQPELGSRPAQRKSTNRKR